MQDAGDFLSYLRVLLENGEIAFDALDAAQEKLIKVTLFKSGADTEEASVAKNEIQMWLTGDAIEYAEFKIKEFIKLGYISPAEFFEFSSITESSKKKNIRIYFKTKTAASALPCPMGKF